MGESKGVLVFIRGNWVCKGAHLPITHNPFPHADTKFPNPAVEALLTPGPQARLDYQLHTNFPFSEFKPTVFQRTINFDQNVFRILVRGADCRVGWS